MILYQHIYIASQAPHNNHNLDKNNITTYSLCLHLFTPIFLPQKKSSEISELFQSKNKKGENSNCTIST